MQQQRRRRSLRNLFWGFVFVGLLASLWSASRRWQTETRNRATEITLDLTELRALSAAEGKPLAAVLRRFQQAGATSVAIQEETIGALEELRQIQALPSAASGETVLMPQNAVVYQRVLQSLQNKSHFGVTEIADVQGYGLPQIEIAQPYNFVRSVGVGLDPVMVAVAKNAGFRIVGRVSNMDGVRPANIAWTLNELKRQGASSVIFSGDEVLGFKGYMIADPKTPTKPSTESVLRETGLSYGLVEFGKQKGDMALAKALPEQTVRVHTVLGSEMLTADFASNVQRFKLAARERNIRMLYVRLFSNEPEPITVNTEKYVAKLAAELKKANLLLDRPAHGFGALETPLWNRALIGVGIAAAFVLLMDSITGLLGGGVSGIVRLLTNVGAAILFFLPVIPGSLGVKFAALAAACIYPTLGLVRRDQLRDEQSFSPLIVALMRLTIMSSVTLLGAAAIVGLLADRLFLIKVDGFMGIKGSQLVPVVIAALVYGFTLHVAEGRTWNNAVSEAVARAKRIASQPLFVWQVIIGLAALFVLLLLVTRSGNDSAVGVSPLELKFRSILDRLLYARPRFKEFLIGHPAMILALALAAKGRRAWAFPLFLVGAIGQVSLLNTFCHLHTPLPISIARALLGLGIGVIIGMVLYFPVDKFLLRRFPHSDTTTR